MSDTESELREVNSKLSVIYSACRSLVLMSLIFAFYLFERDNALELLRKYKEQTDPQLEKCRRVFMDNQCERKNVEPAIADICAKAKSCMRKTPKYPFVAQIVFGNIGEAVNEFLSTLTPSTITTILIACFVYIYFKSIRDKY